MASKPSEEGQFNVSRKSFDTKFPLELREMIYRYSLFPSTYFFYKHPEAFTDEVVLEPAFRPIHASHHFSNGIVRAREIEALQEGTFTALNPYSLFV